MTKDCKTCRFRDSNWDQDECENCVDFGLWMPLKEEANQTAKADAGKPDLTLVPRQIIWDIAEVRRYGNQKYGNPDNWKTVEIERYRAAAFRHFMAYLDDPAGLDPESGLTHLAHLACNVSFLCEMEKWFRDEYEPEDMITERIP